MAVFISMAMGDSPASGADDATSLIVLFNDGTTAVTLTNATIGDDEGDSDPFTVTIPAGSGVVLYDADTNPTDADFISGMAALGINVSGLTLVGVANFPSLNNSGEPLTLKDNTGTPLAPTTTLTDWASGDLAVYDPDGSVASIEDVTTYFTGGTTDLACFLSGTRIATPDGARAVEELQIGDPILTADGRSVRVKWIGRQTVATRFGPAERLMPVRVRAGALGDGLPGRDLTLTADHALLIDGLLINAGALVNGSSINYVPLSELGDSYTVYHVETEAHDVILAEGAPAETYIDYVGRRAFDNYAEYRALYGEDRTIPEMAYPRISSARMLPAGLRRRLGLDHVA